MIHILKTFIECVLLLIGAAMCVSTLAFLILGFGNYHVLIDSIREDRKETKIIKKMEKEFAESE